MVTDVITTRIRDFITSEFLFGDASGMLPDDASLLDSGVMDSTGVLSLIMFLEEEFGISVPDEDVVPEYLDSVDNLTAYIGARLAARTA